VRRHSKDTRSSLIWTPRSPAMSPVKRANGIDQPVRSTCSSPNDHSSTCPPRLRGMEAETSFSFGRRSTLSLSTLPAGRVSRRLLPSSATTYPTIASMAAGTMGSGRGRREASAPAVSSAGCARRPERGRRREEAQKESYVKAPISAAKTSSPLFPFSI